MFLLPAALMQDYTLTTRFMGPTWGWQYSGGPHVGPMNLAIKGIATNQWISDADECYIPYGTQFIMIFSCNSSCMLTNRPRLVLEIAMKADRSSVMVSLNTLQTTVSLNIYKSSANKFGRKRGFKIENEFEDQDQSIPKFTGILTELRCIFGQNLEILTSTGGE